jgi:HlyD family secretion protein
MKRWWIYLLLIVALIAGVWMWKRAHADGKGPNYRTAKVERGDLIQVVRATGVVQPIKLVEVGTQVNGPVQKLYVDFNDQVKQGDLVAQIDPSVYEARLAQDQANLAQSKANVQEVQAKLIQAEKELKRSQELMQRKMLSQAELDTAIANRDTLAAQLQVAQAAVELSEASLRLSKANLDYTTIRSPVDGVVIARNVDEGQTVVASMTAQVLFKIATDLRQVQVEASVPEADIGRIREGQPVTFTVDAYEQEFKGVVHQIRLAATSVQNVVTYPVIIRANNDEGKLFPNMTANITCEVAHEKEVLKVPNAALRFKPSREAGSGDKPAASKPGAKVWVQAKPGAELTPISLHAGISDGSFTEIKAPSDLQEGQEVIVGISDSDKASQGPVNPFAPRFPGRGGRR